ncbi:MAG: ABC transporter substrate-binding protein, partial [Comamonadaceae bacterium]
MTKHSHDGNADAGRRQALRAAAALGAAMAAPGFALAQGEKIRIGHLTPLTGFLGALGEYAVMGIRMATEEINAAGGVDLLGGHP